MGFKDWFQAFKFVVMFGAVVAASCFLIAYWGSQMFNEMGNFPTKSAQIQIKAFWKVLIVEIVTLVLFAGIFQVFY